MIGANSDALLQGSHRECFHNCPCRLGLHHHNLPKDLPLTSLGRWLLTRLDHAQAWKDKLACALHLLSGNAGEAVDDLIGFRLLDLDPRGHNRFSKATFGHGPGSCLHCLHALHRLHRLHGCHDAIEKLTRKMQVILASRLEPKWLRTAT
mmetsp:Transcript_11071/g.8576  ORF Transcript_11071/g.8576 Transcript_11071/m.8576 type:complete len:150 (-) Transcript_11071:14-463(-)